MSTKKNEYIMTGTIETDTYSYKITITTSQRTINNEQIIYSRYFNIGAYKDGTEKKTCVDIYVMYPDLKKELPSTNYKLAKLITTHYNEKCAVNEKLERGEGTRHMINTAMYFVSKACPFVEGFEINDASTRTCDNNTTITLSYFSITNYNKTWYEKNFKAYIGDRDKQEKYNKIIGELQARSLPEWETFDAIFLRTTDKTHKQRLESIYSKSTTYGSLFKNIHKEGVSTACILLQSWIENLMLTTDLRNYILFTQWIIPVTAIKRIPLTGYTKEYFGKLEN